VPEAAKVRDTHFVLGEQAPEAHPRRLPVALPGRGAVGGGAGVQDALPWGWRVGGPRGRQDVQHGRVTRTSSRTHWARGCGEG
jgi:hypothetical protein